jgi:hypothetical protein
MTQAPSLFALIDRPAREALSRAQVGVFSIISPALAGLGLLALSTSGGLLLAGHLELIEPMLRALLEALLLAVPLVLVVTTYALPAVSPSTVASALAISVGVASLAATLVLPLLAFLWLCADVTTWRYFQSEAVVAQIVRALAVPAVFLLGVSVMISRTLSAFSNWGGERIAWLAGLITFSVFLMRLAPHTLRIW